MEHYKFWCWKFTSNSSLNGKSGQLQIEKNIQKFLNAYIKMKKIIKSDDIEFQKQNFHQH